MIFKVKVIPNARSNSVERQERTLRVRLTAPPADGKANKALIKLLAAEFGVSRSQITILKGEKNRLKTVAVGELC